MPTPPEAPEVPVGLRRAGMVVAGEGILLAALSAAYTVLALVGRPDSVLLGLATGAIGIVVGLLLMIGGRGVGRARRAAFSPVLLAQLLAIPVGVTLLQSDRPVPGLVVLALAVSVLVLLFGSSAGRSSMGDA